MVSFTELNQQNDTITELSNVLCHLIDERSVCDLKVTCDLFFSYVDRVKEHLDLEERELYQSMLLHSDQSTRNIANKFLSGSGEIKRVFGQYLKRWSKNKELRIDDHDQFVKDTREMFQLVLNRIEDEVEHLYPTVRVVQVAQKAA
jgi:hemerythrin-like domain-containing protein